MATTQTLGNETQQAKVAEIMASVPVGCTAVGPIESPCDMSVYVDITTATGIDFRLVIKTDGRISKNRKG